MAALVAAEVLVRRAALALVAPLLGYLLGERVAALAEQMGQQQELTAAAGASSMLVKRVRQTLAAAEVPHIQMSPLVLAVRVSSLFDGKQQQQPQ